jgi:hypothetical protein
MKSMTFRRLPFDRRLWPRRSSRWPHARAFARGASGALGFVELVGIHEVAGGVGRSHEFVLDVAASGQLETISAGKVEGNGVEAANLPLGCVVLFKATPFVFRATPTVEGSLPSGSDDHRPKYQRGLGGHQIPRTPACFRLQLPA